MEGNRFEVKKRAMHEHIKQASLELILDSGLDRFNLDSAATKADVSRATLFNHFHSKEELIREAVMPLFNQSMGRLESLIADERHPDIDDVASLCHELWKEHRERIGFAGDMTELGDYPSLSTLRDEFKAGFIRLMSRVGESVRLRHGDPVLCAELVLGCFVPILTAVREKPGEHKIFSKCLAGLVLETASS